MSLKRAQKNAKRLKNKKKSETARKRNQQQIVDAFATVLTRLHLLMLKHSAELMSPYLNGSSELSEASPKLLSLMALLQLFRKIDHDNMCDDVDAAEKEDTKIVVPRAQQMSDFMVNFSEDSRYDVSALQMRIVRLMLPLMMQLNEEVVPNFMRGEDKLGYCCKMIYSEILFALSIIEAQDLYGNDLKPHHTDLLPLGRRLVQGLIDAGHLLPTESIELCERLGAQYLEEIKAGEHELTAAQIEHGCDLIKQYQSMLDHVKKVNDYSWEALRAKEIDPNFKLTAEMERKLSLLFDEIYLMSPDPQY